jgi:uncharacterized protein
VQSGGFVSEFIGRRTQLAVLGGLAARVRDDEGGRPGKALLVRGRRRVGKSRLIEEFLERTGIPHLYFTASTRTTAEELRLFGEEVAASSLPGAALFADVTPTSWDAALHLLAAAVPTDGPSVVVIDEMPYLTASDPAFEGTLQKRFDRDLSRRPVLLRPAVPSTGQRDGRPTAHPVRGRGDAPPRARGRVRRLPGQRRPPADPG